jgi:hypothetical protein
MSLSWARSIQSMPPPPPSNFSKIHFNIIFINFKLLFSVHPFVILMTDYQQMHSNISLLYI